jgi:peptidyl-prolyl cis-trans isomerase B (cyclophilin B)
MRVPESRWLPVAAAAALLAVDPAAAGDGPPRPEEIPALEATIVVSEFGEFTIRFDRQDAPNHVAHFLVLAREGFYDGLEFHRVIPGLLVQSGDPRTRPAPAEDSEDSEEVEPRGPTEPLPYRLPEEPTPRSHERGTVSLAWRDDLPGTAASEWFVVLSDGLDLDGRATPIGRVIEGMDVVDRIAQLPTGRDRRPRHPPRVETVRLQPETPSDAESDGVTDSGGTASTEGG